MANFTGQIVLVDSMKRRTTKEIETETDILANAILAVSAEGALLDDLAAVSDLGVVTTNYSNKDATGAYAAVDPSNVDTGATFRLLLDDGAIVAYKIPGFKQSLAAGDGSIDPDGVEVQAFFANFEAAGSFKLARGRNVVEVLSGQMDK